MKKFFCALIAFSTLMLCSCAKAPDLSESANYNELVPFDLKTEPPISDKVLNNTAKPDFLSDEQYALYLKAYQITPIFYGIPNILEDFPLSNNEQLLHNPTDVTIEDKPFKKSNGRYSNWNDFEAVMKSIYTDNCFIEMNSLFENETFFNVNGVLHYKGLAIGGMFGIDISKTKNKYELIKATDDTITFKILTAQHPAIDNKDQTIIMLKFDVKLILTENGWRVDLFESPEYPPKGYIYRETYLWNE